MRITRRELLGVSAGAAVSPLAGCTSNGSGTDSGCDDMHRSDIEAERAMPPADVREAVVPIRFEELPPEEQDVAARAIRAESYAECSPESDAFESFLDRVREHRSEQQGSSEADLTTVYLVRERTYYALEAVVLDEMISW